MHSKCAGSCLNPLLCSSSSGCEVPNVRVGADPRVRLAGVADPFGTPQPGGHVGPPLPQPRGHVLTDFIPAPLYQSWVVGTTHCKKGKDLVRWSRGARRSPSA